MPAKTIDDYITGLPAGQQRIVRSLIDLVKDAAPGATLSIKWSQPVFEENGPVCYVRAFKRHVNLGFWRGVSLTSADGHLESGGKKMAHFKIFSVRDIRKDRFQAWVKEAVEINRRDGSPNQRRAR